MRLGELRLGVLTQNFAAFPETGRSTRACVDLAVEAERLGFHSAWVTDHIVLPERRDTPYPHNDSGTFPYSWDQDIHDPLVLLGALGVATQHVELGVAVLVIPYRHPLTTAKMLATADQLSGGRIVLGAGVGWLREEFEALALPAEVYERRGAVTVEYLRVMRAAWESEGPVAHDGEFVSFGPVGTRPRPARPIPVWVGGRGEAPLRRAVRFGHGHLAISSDPAQLREEVRRLHDLARSAGRDPSELTVGLIDGIVVHDRPLGRERSPLHGTAEQILDGLTAFADAGLDHLVAGVRPAGDATFAGACDAMAHLAADVLPALAPAPAPVARP